MKKEEGEKKKSQTGKIMRVKKKVKPTYPVNTFLPEKQDNVWGDGAL